MESAVGGLGSKVYCRLWGLGPRHNAESKGKETGNDLETAVYRGFIGMITDIVVFCNYRLGHTG